MDTLSLLAGAAIGGLLGYAIAALRAKSRVAGDQTAAAAQAELEAARRELIALRAQASAALQAESAAKATLAAAQNTVADLRETGAAERARADAEAQHRAKVQQAMAALQTQLVERQHNLDEQRATLARAEQSLKDVFKATGQDVLKSTAEMLIARAREQFDGQKQLTQQEFAAKQKQIDATIAPLREQLAKQEELVRQLGEKREGDVKTLAEQLRQIAELQQKASAAAQTLSSALRDNRQRGRWGEVSLRNIAELAGLSENVDFSEQTSVEGDEGNRLRPDMVVRLPGHRFVPIDAKVPMNAYLDSLDTALSDSDRAARRLDHAQALRNHVRMLASREYEKALGDGVEITVLFVPFESGLIAALEADADIYKEALEKRVIITTSSTLLALLRTCALQWQQAKLNENARRIGENAKELLDRIGKFSEHLEKVRSGIETAAKSYNAAVGSFNSRLLPSARSAADLAGELSGTRDDLLPAEATLREVQTPAPPNDGTLLDDSRAAAMLAGR
jgi:DNA recombination protein RmuC